MTYWRNYYRLATKRDSRGETLISVLCAAGIATLTMTLMLSHLSTAREQARSIYCSNNLKQIAAGMNLYRLQYRRFPNKPLDDFRQLLPYVPELESFGCPSAAEDIKDADSLNGGTSYRYFGHRNDLDAQGLCAYGRCCDGDRHYQNSFDPAHPGKSWSSAYRYGAIFDRTYENHGTGCLNIVYLDDNHWERLCSALSCYDRSIDGTDPGDVDVESDTSTSTTEEETTTPASTEEETTTSTSTSDPELNALAIDEHEHVHVRSRGDDAEITCEFERKSVYVTSTKDLSNVVIEFRDGMTQKYDGLTGYTGTFVGTGDNLGKIIVGCWVKSGKNASGDGPGYGEYFPAT